jgi:VWFA-related protein
LRPLVTFLVVILFAVAIAAQTDPKPSPTPKTDEQEQRVRVFTEEVRLPVVATDSGGHYDAGLEADEVLVLEDGEPQQIRSIRHIPGNVLLILDTGGGDNIGLGGLSKKTSTTRAVALRILSLLPSGDQIAVLQSSDKPDLLQPWTGDKQQIARVLNSKLYAGKRSRLFESMVKAAQVLADRPEGSRHVVLITDGVETPGGKTDLDEGLKKMAEARATVHIISYTTLVRQKDDKQPSNVTGGQRPASENPITANDPTLPPGSTRSPSFGVSIRFDPAMKRKRKAYEKETENSEKWLTDLAAETGGTIFLPTSSEEMMNHAEQVAREIGAEYIVTYRPKRPLSAAKPGEYRRVEVASRRSGLYLRTRKGYFVPQSQ